MKNLPVQVRVSQSEKNSFQDAAKAVGVSLSAWARAALRKAAIHDLENVGKIAEFLIKEDESND